MSKRLEKLRPRLYVRSITLIPFDHISYSEERWFYAFDIDNCLADGKRGLDKKSVQAIKRAVKAGYIQGMVLLSNTIGPKKARRAHAFARELSRTLEIQVTAICLNLFQAKPSPYGFKMACKTLGCSSREMVMVGDQLASDIKGGNKAGFYTILRDAINPKGYSPASHLAFRVIRNRLAFTKLRLEYTPIKPRK